MKLKFTGTGPRIIKDDDGIEYGKVRPGDETPEIPKALADALLESQPSNFKKVRAATKSDSTAKKVTS